MFKSLLRLLAAASLSLTLALTGIVASPTPAQADNENLRRFLGAAAGIALLGTVLNNNRNNGHPHYAPPTRQVIVPPVRHSLVAPSRCYTRFSGPQGHFSGFGAQCMQSSYYANQLPSSCLDRVFTNRGWRHVYDAQCLYRHGWVRS